MSWPNSSRSFSTDYEICGASVEKGEFSYWCDTSKNVNHEEETIF